VEVIVFAALVAVGCAAIGAYVSSHNGRGVAEGFLLGLMLGPFGVGVAALMPERKPDREEEEAMRYLGDGESRPGGSIDGR
jgi:hypothetical protein